MMAQPQLVKTNRGDLQFKGYIYKNKRWNRFSILEVQKPQGHFRGFEEEGQRWKYLVTYDDQLDVISQEQNSADVLAQLPSLESIRSSLYRARHEDTPILPTRCQSLYQILKHLEVGKTSSWLTMEMMTRSDSCLMQRPFTLMAHSQHALHCSTRYIIMYMNIFINLFSAGVYNPYSAYISNGIAFCLTIMLLKDAALVKFPGISFDVEVVVSAGHGSNSYHHGCYYHFMQAINNNTMLYTGSSPGASPSPQWGVEGIRTIDGHWHGFPSNRMLRTSQDYHLDQWKLSTNSLDWSINISLEPTTMLRDGILEWKKL